MQIQIKAIDLIFTKNDLFETLSAYSQENDRLVKNNKKFWSDVNQALPKTEIKIYGPHQNTGTHETLVNFIMLDQYSCMNSRIFKENYKDQEKERKHVVISGMMEGI